MKTLYKTNRLFTVTLIFSLFLLSAPLFAQNYMENTTIPAYEYNEERYRFLIDDENADNLEWLREGSTESADMFEDFFYYNDIDIIPQQMLIRFFTNLENFNIFNSANDTPDAGKSAVLYKNPSSGNYEITVDTEYVSFTEYNYSLFYQFIETHIPNTPDWLKAGLSVYLNEEIRMSYLPWYVSDYNIYTASFVSQILKSSLDIKETIKNLMTGEIEFDNELHLPFCWAIIEYFSYYEDYWVYEDFFKNIFQIVQKGNNAQEIQKNITDYLNQWEEFENIPEDINEFLHDSYTVEDYYARGSELYEEGDIDELENLALAFLYHDESNTYGYYLYGLMCYRTEEYDSAIEVFNEALELGGAPGLLNYAIGLCYFKMEEYNLAREFFDIAVNANPEKYSPLTEAVTALIE